MKKILILLLITTLLTLTACTKTVEQVKKEEMVGKKVSLTGTVSNAFKLGQVSGFTLTDKNSDAIVVAAERLPPNGAEMRITGVVKKAPIIGYYIDAVHE